MRTRLNRTRFAGIVADARELSVTRVHLYLVLSRKRTSRSLLARYRALKTRRAEG